MVAMTGMDMGAMMRNSVTISLAPSMRAESSISVGMVIRKLRMMSSQNAGAS